MEEEKEWKKGRIAKGRREKKEERERETEREKKKIEVYLTCTQRDTKTT